MLFEGGEFGSDDTSLVWLISSSTPSASRRSASAACSRTPRSRWATRADRPDSPRSGHDRRRDRRPRHVPARSGLHRADGIEALGDTIGLAGPLDTDQRTDESLVRLGRSVWPSVPPSGVGRADAAGQAPRSSLAGAAAPVIGALATDDCRIDRLRRHGGDEPADRITSVPVAVVLTVGVGGFVYVVACFRTGVREADMVLRPATSDLALSRRRTRRF